MEGLGRLKYLARRTHRICASVICEIPTLHNYNRVVNLRGPQAVNTWPIVAKPLALRYRNSGPSEATIMDALLVMHQDEPLPPLCNGERYPGGARLGHGSMGETVKVSLAIAHANKCCRSKTRVLVKYIPISAC